MSNILVSEQNKELLWNILSSNKAFVNIPESKFPNVKAIFESNITKIFNENKEIFTSNYKTGDSKNIVMQLNKIILQNIMLDINSFKKSLLVPAHIKDIYKNEKSEEFDKELLEKKVSFSNLITKKVPETIDFSETKDSPLENNSMNELLERIQRERNNDLPMPVPVSSINVSNTNQNQNQNQNQLEVVDLNKFDAPLPLFNEENTSMLEKETTTNKTKILNMEDLINSFSSTATATTTENTRELSRENSNLKKFVANENNSELNLNLNIKLDFLNKQMEKVLSNQKLIMAKLSI
jgi:type III secretory pathway component EscV